MNEKYIAGIYNYCDSYCQRCRFAERCHIANESLDDTLGQIDDDNVHNNTQKSIEEILESSQEMLAKMAESMGISMEDLMNMSDDTNADLGDNSDDDNSLFDPFTHPAFEAAMELRQLIDVEIENEDIQSDQPHIGTIIFMIREGLLAKTMKRADYEQTFYHIESILWYYSAIDAKVGRAIAGLANPDEDDDPIQNDANGSAKAAMNMIEQLVEALTHIQKRHHVQLQHIIAKAEELSIHITTLFPNHAKFIRPGFDTHV
jgi:hypothetical protein